MWTLTWGEMWWSGVNGNPHISLAFTIHCPGTEQNSFHGLLDFPTDFSPLAASTAARFCTQRLMSKPECLILRLPKLSPPEGPKWCAHQWRGDSCSLQPVCQQAQPHCPSPWPWRPFLWMHLYVTICWEASLSSLRDFGEFRSWSLASISVLPWPILSIVASGPFTAPIQITCLDHAIHAALKSPNGFLFHSE